MRRVAVLPLLVFVLAACTTETFTLAASPPFGYAAVVDQSVERIAIVVTITNRSQDDLLISPADFAARDQDHRIYPANPAATITDARLVATAARQLGIPGVLPMPVVTLRKDDVITGFIVFDVPGGVRPTQLVFRQSDTDRVVELSQG